MLILKVYEHQQTSLTQEWSNLLTQYIDLSTVLRIVRLLIGWFARKLIET